MSLDGWVGVEHLEGADRAGRQGGGVIGRGEGGDGSFGDRHLASRVYSLQVSRELRCWVVVVSGE
jgi:hypothetical protein